MTFPSNYIRHKQLRDISRGIQARGKEAISASFGRPEWKLAYWHIFQRCPTKEACDHEAMESFQSHWVQQQTSAGTKRINWNDKGQKGCHICKSQCKAFSLLHALLLQNCDLCEHVWKVLRQKKKKTLIVFSEICFYIYNFHNLREKKN